jgi:hypothetical protein
MEELKAVEGLKTEVRIHINRQKYVSPNPTTGKHLYELGHIQPHQELFREVGGDHEDQPVPNNDHVIHLNEDEHFYSERVYEVIVNARKKEVTTHYLTFDEVVKLADEPPPAPTTVYTITYRKGPHENPEGDLLQGQKVRVKNGMVFNVKRTDKS